MPQEFEGDLAGAVFWGADLSGARFPWPDLDYDLTPTFAQTLAVHSTRATRCRDFLASMTMADFARPVDVLENGAFPIHECIYTVFEEAFWHNRYARRDLESLESDHVGVEPN